MQNQKVMFSGFFLLTIIVMTPLAFSSSLGDDWTSIKNSLSNAEKSSTVTEGLSHVNDAHLIYINSFKNAALEVDSASDNLIENAIDDIVTNHNNGDIEMASLNRQVIDKTIYKIAYMKMELAVEKNKADDFIAWYSVLDKKFIVSEKDYESNKWIAEIQSTPSTLSSKGPAILEELLVIFKLKTIEELEEAIAALEENDVKSAKTFAYEGLYYYRTLHPSIEEKLGTETANDLLHEMEEAIAITMSNSSPSAMKSEIEQISSEVELIIREYEGGDTSEIGLALSGIRDRLILVEVEYLDAVSNGQIINQVEYDEAVVFLEKAITIFESVKPSLIELSESDASSLESNLDEIDAIVSTKGETAQIKVLVKQGLVNVNSLEGYAGGALEIDIFQYFEKIDQLLNDAKISYRNGDTQAAFDAVTFAYLDNYEFIEGPLGKVDHDLMEKIEVDMREDLRNMIKSNVSADEVNAQIDMILTDLAAAKKVVPEFGTIALMILAVAIVSVIAISSKSKLNILTRF